MVPMEELSLPRMVPLSASTMTEGGGVRDEYVPEFRALARFKCGFLSTYKAISQRIQGLFIQLWR
jgi:hypothetical protein